MERQTKHRILGILVMIGLVVILLPLFQGGKEVSTKATLVKAPPFPDQTLPMSSPATVEMASAATSSSTIPSPQADIDQQNQPKPTTGSSVNSEMAKSTIASTLSSPPPSEDIMTKKTALLQTAQYKIIEGEKAASLLNKTKHKSKHANKTKNIPTKEVKSVAAVKIKPEKTLSFKNSLHKAIAKNTPASQTKNSLRSGIVKNTLHAKPVKPSLITASIDDDGLIKLKSAVWVIQVGSFKNKANALKIVNQLRLNGYRAFIQQFSTALDDHTSVFVGPENNPAAARTLADRLKSEMHIQGIVISYKPLTL